MPHLLIVIIDTFIVMSFVPADLTGLLVALFASLALAESDSLHFI